MDKVIAKSKLYENVVIKHNPQIELMKNTVPIVKEFIRKRGLLLYGGTAIDYALRLKGDCIYPDESLDVPDLDFYSPQHAEDAYELADILYKLGYKDVAAHRALYVLAMRVDIGGNNIVADIGWIDKDIFEHIPYVEYEGMKVMHPHYQMIDVHSSLSFPFDDASTNFGEILFNRWKKDIVRYNKLYSYYPIPQPPPADILAPNTVNIPIDFATNVFMGFAAYAMLYEALKMLLDVAGMPMPKNIISSEFKIGKDAITIQTVNSQLQFITTDTDKFSSNHFSGKVHLYMPYKDIIPNRAESVIKDTESGEDVTISAHSTDNRLVGISSIKINNHKLQMVSAQHILLYLLIRYNTLDGKQSSTAAAYYISTLKIIETAELAIAKIGKIKGVGKNSKGTAITSFSDNIADMIKHAPFFPSINMYGSSNYSDATDSIRQKALEFIDKTPPTPTPARYMPSKNKPHPKFDYTKSKYFRRTGKERIVKDNKIKK